MKNRMAWWLAVLLVVLLLVGGWIGIVEFVHAGDGWGFDYKSTPGGFHGVQVGPAVIAWGPRPH
jgi:hypothetical protein